MAQAFGALCAIVLIVVVTLLFTGSLKLPGSQSPEAAATATAQTLTRVQEVRDQRVSATAPPAREALAQVTAAPTQGRTTIQDLAGQSFAVNQTVKHSSDVEMTLTTIDVVDPSQVRVNLTFRNNSRSTIILNKADQGNVYLQDSTGKRYFLIAANNANSPLTQEPRIAPGDAVSGSLLLQAPDNPTLPLTFKHTTYPEIRNLRLAP